MLAVEEAILFLCEESEIQKPEDEARGRLMVRLGYVKGEVEIEMMTAPSERNAEEMMGQLSDAESQNIEDNLSLRLLSRTVKTLKHLQFRQGDYLLMRIDSTA